MEIKQNNKTITYNGEDIINILKEIEVMLESLHYMGSYYADNINEKRQEYEKETTNFIDNSLICDRLASIRRKLIESFDLELGDDNLDDVERACSDIEIWSKPGDYLKEFWL